MAWNALRYYCVLSKIGSDLRSFKQQQVRSKLFDVWRQRTGIVSKAKDKFYVVLKKATQRHKQDAMDVWRRRAYLERTLALLQYFTQGDGNREWLQHIVLAWRKYTYLKRNRALLTAEF